jgi:hypothetical protein
MLLATCDCRARTPTLAGRWFNFDHRLGRGHHGSYRRARRSRLSREADGDDHCPPARHAEGIDDESSAAMASGHTHRETGTPAVGAASSALRLAIADPIKPNPTSKVTAAGVR